MPRFVKCKECGLSTLYISWTSLRTHEECHQKGYLSRGRKRNKLKDSRAFFPGTVTDRVVRDWLENDPAFNLGLMPQMVESVIAREERIIQEEGGFMKWKDASDKATVLRDCIEAVTKIEDALVRYVLPNEYQADMRFRAPLLLPHPDGSTESVVLNGAMDILVKDGKGRWFVFDVKHTKDESYWRKTVGQLTFYDLAVNVMFGEPTSGTALFQPLCKEQVKSYPINDQKRNEIMQRIVGMADAVWREDRTPRADMSLCNWCDVKHACSKFAPVIDAKGKKRLAF